MKRFLFVCIAAMICAASYAQERHVVIENNTTKESKEYVIDSKATNANWSKEYTYFDVYLIQCCESDRNGVTMKLMISPKGSSDSFVINDSRKLLRDINEQCVESDDEYNIQFVHKEKKDVLCGQFDDRSEMYEFLKNVLTKYISIYEK